MAGLSGALVHRESCWGEFINVTAASVAEDNGSLLEQTYGLRLLPDSQPVRGFMTAGFLTLIADKK